MCIGTKRGFFLSLKHNSQSEWKNYGVEDLLLVVDTISLASILSLICSVPSLVTWGMEERVCSLHL